MKICIDAGHYGKYNQSPADSRYYESDFTWKLHLLQKKYLEEYGIEVITTRSDQSSDRGLYSRGAASKGCALFISDHTNAVGTTVNDSIDYPAAYCAINGSADGIGIDLAQCVEQVIGTRQPARIEHRRGKNGDYYGVLRGATAVGTPGLILEHSFHTNTQIVRWLLNEDNIDRLAKAEAKTIALYYNVIDPIPEKKSGWVQEEGGWRFYLGNTGEPVRNDWYQDGEDWYWFDEAGMMVYNNWKIGGDGKWYFLNENGAMARNQWVVWKYELYRVTEDGSMFEGSMCLETDEKGALVQHKEDNLETEGPISRMRNVQEESSIQGESGIQEESSIQGESRIQEESSIQEESEIQEESGIQEESSIQKESSIQEEGSIQEESGIQEESSIQKESSIQRGNAFQNEIRNQKEGGIQKENNIQEKINFQEKRRNRSKRENQPHKKECPKKKPKNSKKAQKKRDLKNNKRQKKQKTAIQANLIRFLLNEIEGFTTQYKKGKRGTGKK